MAPISRLAIAKQDIVKLFDESETRVYARKDIERILSFNRKFWRLAKSTTTNRFLDFLLDKTQMEHQEFEFPKRTTDRYTWGDVPVYELVQSLRPECYLTHYSAMHLHGLTLQAPRAIYVNFEQRACGGGGELIQSNIDKAFKRKCRVTRSVATFRERTVHLLNGQNTSQLGVQEIDTEFGHGIRLTNIERTLIDATVRPVYAGGVFEVAKAYQLASEQVSVNRLSSYLKRLNYTYPYHQAIGFYMERAGAYSNAQIALLRQSEIEFDFYLAHDLKEVDYVQRWRLYVPKGF